MPGSGKTQTDISVSVTVKFVECGKAMGYFKAKLVKRTKKVLE